MRVVLDANVLVSAAISTGPSHRIVDAWLRGEPFELVICDRLLSEVRSVLVDRSGMRRWISPTAAELYIARLTSAADIESDPAPGPPLTRDPDDDYVIHLAREHAADLIVSGDADLLEWAEQRPPVVTPAAFEERMEIL